MYRRQTQKDPTGIRTAEGGVDAHHIWVFGGCKDDFVVYYLVPDDIRHDIGVMTWTNKDFGLKTSSKRQSQGM